MSSPIFTVAQREWKTTVFRWQFVIMTFLPPIFILIIFSIIGPRIMKSVAPTSSSVQTSMRNVPVGIYDPSHVLNPTAYQKPLNGAQYRMIDRLDTGQLWVARNKIAALVVVPRDYIQDGKFILYENPDNPAASTAASAQLIISSLRAGLLYGHVDTSIANRVTHPVYKGDIKVYDWNSKEGAYQSLSVLQQMEKFLVPYACAVLLLMTILTGTGYLLHGIAEEKENRVMEILLSSITHEELLWGKLIGLGAAGLTPFAMWSVISGIPTMIMIQHLPPAIRPPVLTLIMIPVLFILGFTFYGSIIAGFGSLASSVRESQQATMLVIFPPLIPLLLFPTIIISPDGLLARGLSWFPPTSPITLMLRLSSGQIQAWDLCLGIASLAVGIWLVQKLTAKLFRLGTLLYGKSPTPFEVVRWLRYA